MLKRRGGFNNVVLEKKIQDNVFFKPHDSFNRCLLLAVIC